MKSWQPRIRSERRSYLITLAIVMAINAVLIVYAALITFGR